jgi:hypothetical protein
MLAVLGHQSVLQCLQVLCRWEIQARATATACQNPTRSHILQQPRLSRWAQQCCHRHLLAVWEYNRRGVLLFQRWWMDPLRYPWRSRGERDSPPSMIMFSTRTWWPPLILLIRQISSALAQTTNLLPSLSRRNTVSFSPSLLHFYFLNTIIMYEEWCLNMNRNCKNICNDLIT